MWCLKKKKKKNIKNFESLHYAVFTTVWNYNFKAIKARNLSKVQHRVKKNRERHMKWSFIEMLIYRSFIGNILCLHVKLWQRLRHFSHAFYFSELNSWLKSNTAKSKTESEWKYLLLSKSFSLFVVTLVYVLSILSKAEKSHMSPSSLLSMSAHPWMLFHYTGVAGISFTVEMMNPNCHRVLC